MCGCGGTGNTTASDKGNGASGENAAGAVGENVTENYLSGKYTVEIQIQDYGTIVVELDADAAPIMVPYFRKTSR